MDVVNTYVGEEAAAELVTKVKQHVTSVINTEVENRNTAIASAIDALDAMTVGGTGKYIAAISETDGVISATEGAIDSTVTANSDNLITSGAVATAIDTEVTNRNNAISSAIDTEVADRNSAISSAISTEVTNRNNAISSAIATEVADRNSAISSAISTEVTNRNNAISSAIDTEVTNRNSAITSAIEALDSANVGGSGKYVASVSEAEGIITATEGVIDSTPTQDSTNLITSGGVESALASEAQTRSTNDTNLSNRITSIEDVIPAQATVNNKLADKAFVNSTIQTTTANFRGNWPTWAAVPTVADDYPEDYAGSKTPTVNDYLILEDASGYTEASLSGSWRFKYTGDWSTLGKAGWLPEYKLNDTSFTAEQLAALNSGVTSTKVGNYDSHLSNTSNPHNVTKSQVGLGNVANTGDSALPAENGTEKFTTGGAYTELNKKVDKEAGKSLTSNDFTDTLKNKLDGIEAGAQVNTITGVKGNSETDYRTGNVSISKEDIGLGDVGNFKAVSTVANQGLTSTEQTNARTNIGAGTSSFSGSYNDLNDKPVIDSTVTASSANLITSGAVAEAIANAKYEVSIGDGNDPDNYPNDAVRIYRVRNYSIGWLSNDGFIIHIPWSTSYVFQIALDEESKVVMIRNKVIDAWTAWGKIALSSELSNAISSAISTEVTNRNRAITNAINALDVTSAGGAGKYISAISETDGKIAATEGVIDNTPTTGSNNLVTSGGVAAAISGATGTVNYNDLQNKPSINGHVVSDSKTGHQYDLANYDDLYSTFVSDFIWNFGNNYSLSPIDMFYDNVTGYYYFLSIADGNNIYYATEYGGSIQQLTSVIPVSRTPNFLKLFKFKNYYFLINDVSDTSTYGLWRNSTLNNNNPDYNFTKVLGYRIVKHYIFNDILFLCTHYYGIWYTTDGETFTQIQNTGSGYGTEPIITSICYDSSEYLGYSGTYFYTASDGLYLCDMTNKLAKLDSISVADAGIISTMNISSAHICFTWNDSVYIFITNTDNASVLLYRQKGMSSVFMLVKNFGFNYTYLTLFDTFIFKDEPYFTVNTVRSSGGDTYKGQGVFYKLKGASIIDLPDSYYGFPENTGRSNITYVFNVSGRAFVALYNTAKFMSELVISKKGLPTPDNNNKIVIYMSNGIWTAPADCYILSVYGDDSRYPISCWVVSAVQDSVNTNTDTPVSCGYSAGYDSNTSSYYKFLYGMPYPVRKGQKVYAAGYNVSNIRLDVAPVRYV